MTVSLRGYTQGAFSAFGTFSVAWPSGTAVGDMAVFLAATGSDKKPATVFPSGWQQKGVKSDGTSLWWKILTSADIGSPLTVKARVELGAVLTGAAGVGSLGSGESLKIAAGGALLLAGWRFTTDDLTAGKIHAADVVNESYVYKGTARRYNLWLGLMPTAGTAYIDTNAGAFFAVEVLPRTTPYAPTVLLPEDGAYLDYAAPATFTWQANAAAGLPVTECVRMTLRSVSEGGELGLPKYVTLDAGDNVVLSSALAELNGDWSGVAFSTSLLPNNGQWQWTVRTSGTSDRSFGPESDPRVFNLRTKPSVAPTVAGSGLARTVSWTPTITNGSQEWWRVRICAAADATPGNPIHDTGVQPGADVTYAIPTDAGYLNGAAYKAWVEVGQTGGQQTIPTASSSFTVSWTPPTPPTLTVNTSTNPATLTAHGLTGRTHLKVQFTAGHLDHEIMLPVTAASMTISLPLAPYAVPTQYTAAASTIISGVEMWSEPATILATSHDPTPRLVSVNGLDWIPVVVWSDSDRSDSEGVLASYGLGATRPAVTRTPSQGATGTTSLKARTRAELDTLTAWMQAHPTFILRWAPERAGHAWADVPATRMAAVTPRGEERLAQTLLQARIVTFSWVEQ